MARALILLRTPPDTLLERIGQLAGHQRGFRFAVLGAACVHAGFVSVLGDARPEEPLGRWTNPVSELVIDLPEPETPPLPSAPEPPPAASPEPSRAPAIRREAPAAAAPQAARAAAVLTQSEDNEQPVDFTDSIVVGTAATYAGGITRSDGTSARAVRAAGSPTTKPAVLSAVGTASGTGPDLSRVPGVLGGLAWSCPFPPEADADSVNHAQVAIRVEVDANGRPTRVLVLSDPGHGFASAARACALGKRWTPGADRSGRATASGINLSVRFVR